MGMCVGLEQRSKRRMAHLAPGPLTSENLSGRPKDKATLYSYSKYLPTINFVASTACAGTVALLLRMASFSASA